MRPQVVDDVKVFHMVAEGVDHELAPGLKVKCWGYNGRVHGPLIEFDGDRVRIYVTNRGYSIHPHRDGIDVQRPPAANDDTVA